MLPITFLPWNGGNQSVDQRLNLQIRRSGPAVQDRPSPVAGWRGGHVRSAGHPRPRAHLGAILNMAQFGNAKAIKSDGRDGRGRRPSLPLAVGADLFTLERVTGIEPALSAWELYGAARLRSGDSVTCGDIAGMTVSDRDCPQVHLLSGT